METIFFFFKKRFGYYTFYEEKNPINMAFRVPRLLSVITLERLEVET